MRAMIDRIVVGITGASGAAYARRVMQLLAEAGVEIHLAVSALGQRLLFEELGLKRIDADALTGGHGELVTVYSNNDVGAAIASGSFLHAGMVIVPCSSNTLGAIASGLSDNLVKRAAAVTLKERRRLVLLVRETPFNDIHLENMLKLSRMGVVIAPPVPGFYNRPETLDDIVNHTVNRTLDLFDIHLDGAERWSGMIESDASGPRPLPTRSQGVAWEPRND